MFTSFLHCAACGLTVLFGLFVTLPVLVRLARGAEDATEGE